MDYYEKGYPMNSQLQYSSSHVYTEVGEYNNYVQLKQGNQNGFNQNYFHLPDATYLLYGLSAFTLNQQSSTPLFSIILNLDISGYSVITPANSVQNVIISADLFIKNIMNLCDSQSK
jgi:hypothetical protein